MKKLTRRDALTGATALGAVALAGCVASNDDGSGGPDDGNPASGSDGSDGDSSGEDSDGSDGGSGSELELVDAGVTTTAADCGRGDLVEATVEGSTITLEGMVSAATPCHEAVLDGATLDEGALTVSVGVEDATGDGGGCVQCTGLVEYEATLAFSSDLGDLSPFESFTVEHGGRSGETFTIEEAGVVKGRVARRDGQGERDDERDDEGAVVGRSIATTDSGCTDGVGEDAPRRSDVSEAVDVSRTDDTVTVTGTIRTSTPCYEAYIEDVGYDSGVLSLVVGPRRIEEDQFCVECLGRIQYEAAISLAEGTAVDDVSVTHIEGGASP